MQQNPWYEMVMSQGRSQDFPEGASIPIGRGVPIYYPVKFSQKLHKNEDIWTKWRGRVSKILPFLRSAIVSST